MDVTPPDDDLKGVIMKFNNIDTLANNLEAAVSELAKVREELESSENRREQAEAKVRELSSELLGAKLLKSIAEDRIAIKESTISFKDASISSLRSTVNSVEETRDAYKGLFKEAEAKLAEAEKKVADLELRLAIRTGQRDELRDGIENAVRNFMDFDCEVTPCVIAQMLEEAVHYMEAKVSANQCYDRMVVNMTTEGMIDREEAVGLLDEYVAMTCLCDEHGKETDKMLSVFMKRYR